MEPARVDARSGFVGVRDVFLDGGGRRVVGPGQLRGSQLLPRRLGCASAGAQAAGDLAGVGAVGAGQRHDRRPGRRRSRPLGPRRNTGAVQRRSDGIVRHRTDCRPGIHRARPHRCQCAADPRGRGATDVRRPGQRAGPAPGRRFAGRREVEIGSGAPSARAYRTRTARRPAGPGARAHRHRFGQHRSRGDRPGEGVSGVGL